MRDHRNFPSLSLSTIVCKLGPSEAIWIETLDCFVWYVPGYPEISLNVEINWAFGDTYNVVVKAWGEAEERDAWQRAFDLWCGSLGQNPRFTRGNVRTRRTQAHVILVGAHSVLSLLKEWMGLDGLHVARGLDARVADLEEQVFRLRKQAVQAQHQHRSTSRTRKPRPEDLAQLARIFRLYPNLPVELRLFEQDPRAV